MKLIKSLNTWNTPNFPSVLKSELEALAVHQLPLQAAMMHGNSVLDDDLKVMINTISYDQEAINVTVGIFFSSMISGCNCADDPTPAETQHEYCEVELAINKLNGETSVCLRDG